MNDREKEEFAQLFKVVWEKSFDILFYELKTRGFTITKMDTEPSFGFSGYKQQPYTITVNFLDRNCNEGRITFYCAFPKKCLSSAMKNYQILSFNINVPLKGRIHLASFFCAFIKFNQLFKKVENRD